MKLIHFVASFAIWLTCMAIPWVVGWFLIPIMLACGWDGYTTIWGNYLYGRIGNSHLIPPVTLWKSYVFLAWRNPVSNLGKQFLDIDPPYPSWAWLYDVQIVGRFWWKYGWAIDGAGGKFVFRPWLK